MRRVRGELIVGEGSLGFRKGLDAAGERIVDCREGSLGDWKNLDEEGERIVDCGEVRLGFRKTLIAGECGDY